MNSRLLTRFSKPEKPSTNYGKETIRTMQLNVRAEVKDFQLHSAHDLFLSAQNPKLTENEPKYRFSFENRFLINYHNILYDTLRPSVSELGQGPLIENCNQRLLGLVQDRGFKAFMTLATFHWKLLTRFTKPEKPRALIMEKKLGILTRLFHIPYHTLRPSVSELVARAVFWPFWPCRPFWLLSIGKQRSLEGI